MQVTDQTRANRVRERAKLLVRGVLHRFDLELSGGVYARRLARSLAVHDVDTVLDIGANVGQFAVSLRRAGFDGRVISCEPLSGAFGELSRRAARDAAWTVHNVAVGSERGATQINVSANSYSSSVLPMTDVHRAGAPGSDYIAVETVDVTTVADLVTEHGIDPGRTLLKVDTQGYEAQVLAGAGPLMEQFAMVQLELSLVPLYEGQVLAEEMVSRLRSWGFRLHTLEPGFSDAAGRLLQLDVLVVRDQEG